MKKLVIDAHCHLLKEKDYLKNLIKTMEKLKIDQTWLHAIGLPFDTKIYGGNKEVKEAFTRYPKLFKGFAYIRLGKDNAKMVDRYYKEGFKGLKVIYPPHNYDDKSFYPIYSRAEKFKMPIMFHLGAGLNRTGGRKGNVSMGKMRPVHLDTLARAFPEIILIGAHLGNPWYEESAEVIRTNPNIYMDITGSTLVKKKPSYFKGIFWWDRVKGFYRGSTGPYKRVLFGTDLHYNQMASAVDDYRRLMQGLHLSKQAQKDIWGLNAERVFGVKC